MKLFFITLLFSTGCRVATAQSRPDNRVTRYVSPFIGTGAADTSGLSGCTFPGATLPFGFVQLSPDTQESPEEPASGYSYKDKFIYGFSHTHLSGTGVSDLFDILVMPTTGPLKLDPQGYRSAFSHENENARPGYYRVALSDYQVDAELTATTHVGFHRYTFPQSQTAHLIIDLNHTMDKARTGYYPCQIIDAQIRVVNNRTIEGYRVLTGWAKLRKVYFRAVFSKPFQSVTLANGNSTQHELAVINGNQLRAGINFATTANEKILVKIALSPVSLTNARLNLKTECPTWDFNAVRQNATAAWEKELGKVQVEGSAGQKQIFYTALYHAFIQPNQLSDVNGEYPAEDYTTLHGRQYSTFSLWDTYRAAHPLYTLSQPKRTADFVNSLIRQYENYGYLPIWQLWNQENYCMTGNHAIPVIVDAVLKRLPGIDPEKAYRAVKNSSINDHPGSPFKILEQFHYQPADIVTSRSVSITLEEAYDDWCVAQLAKHLRKNQDYQYFLNRSNNYHNLFNPQTGFFQAKKQDGSWVKPFDPLAYGYGGSSPYTEANGWQSLWQVPQNLPDLLHLLGGKEAFIQKLDTFFTLNAKSKDMDPDASGFIGQYAQGNEPSHHIAYLYDYVGQPWKTQQYVAKILNQLYSASPAGYAGNEDCGQMSAWYIFSAMGFYPVNPASGVYAIGSPILARSALRLSTGKTFTIVARGVSASNCYIQSAKLNGKPFDKAFLTQSQIAGGGKLEFTMGEQPNKNWAAANGSAPPQWGYRSTDQFSGIYAEPGVSFSSSSSMGSAFSFRIALICSKVRPATRHSSSMAYSILNSFKGKAARLSLLL